MRTAELDYDLPGDLIAQTPAEPRSSARLMVYDRATGEVRHRVFSDLPDELRDDDLIVVNNTRVLPARIHARRATGGAVELLLLEQRPDGAWDALARPSRRLRAGETLDASGTPILVADVLQEGHVTVTLDGAVPDPSVLERIGEMPVPPYIHRPLERADDYQTVYARSPGSAAAPTAGLHFTAEMWAEMRRRYQVLEVTLAVGLDTFRPVSADDLADHALHTEAYEVAEEAALGDRSRPRRGAPHRGRRHHLACGCSRRSGAVPAPALRPVGALHHARVRIRRNRRDGDQLPPAALDAARDGDGVRRHRRGAPPLPHGG